MYIALILVTVTFKGPNRKDLVKDPVKEQVKQQTVNGSESTFFGFFQKYKKFTVLLIASTLLFACHNAINSYMINIVEQVGGDSSHMGKAVALAAIVEFPVMMVYIFMCKKIPSSFWIKLSCIFFTIKAIITLFATSMTGIYIGQFIQIAAFAIFLPATIYYTNELMDSKDKIGCILTIL